MSLKTGVLNTFFQVVTVALLLLIYFKKNSESAISIQGQAAADRVSPQLFIDSKGEIVDAYQRRQVKNTVTANARSLQLCFNKLVEKGELGNKTSANVNLDWTVAVSGVANDVRVVFSDVDNRDFKECLIEAIEKWSFPKPHAATYTEHRFNFSKSSVVNNSN